jgi:NAD(P)H-dependent FMN reductase
MKILAVSGSLQAHSKNRALLTTAAGLTPPGVELVLFDGIGDLPHFNPDLERSALPGSVLRWRQLLADSDAIVIACPEYGFSLPGVLKNAIDWVIGSGELERKVVAITAAVPGPERGRRGLQALRDTLAAVRASIVGGEPIPIGPEFESRAGALLADVIQAVRKRAVRVNRSNATLGGNHADSAFESGENPAVLRVHPGNGHERQ